LAPGRSGPDVGGDRPAALGIGEGDGPSQVSGLRAGKDQKSAVGDRARLDERALQIGIGEPEVIHLAAGEVELEASVGVGLDLGRKLLAAHREGADPPTREGSPLRIDGPAHHLDEVRQDQLVVKDRGGHHRRDHQDLGFGEGVEVEKISARLDAAQSPDPWRLKVKIAAELSRSAGRLEPPRFDGGQRPGGGVDPAFDLHAASQHHHRGGGWHRHPSCGDPKGRVLDPDPNAPRPRELQGGSPILAGLDRPKGGDLLFLPPAFTPAQGGDDRVSDRMVPSVEHLHAEMQVNLRFGRWGRRLERGPLASGQPPAGEARRRQHTRDDPTTSHRGIVGPRAG
jgi:hypothetical protein